MRLQIPPLEGIQDDLETLGRRQVPVEEDDLLPPDPTCPAAHTVADFAEQGLLPHGQPHASRQLFRLLAQGLGPSAHTAFLSDGPAFARVYNPRGVEGSPLAVLQRPWTG